ncbi:phage/plasmid primase, P4 family [Bifidobacterium sp. ESL0745]|uniref:DNA primase family protein n=1 Tax=Bifidobacterium sp. ESL0745 TaxID=2983226 RepID=UPI0023F7BA6A|nr:phage/plasmid primase, P4 family [Bifidobacterium sp. ESL0745]MDF7666127.1 phage/plasmid primase, P4 family [Bifidobacterium sp. ESL0745]
MSEDEPYFGRPSDDDPETYGDMFARIVREVMDWAFKHDLCDIRKIRRKIIRKSNDCIDQHNIEMRSTGRSDQKWKPLTEITPHQAGYVFFKLHRVAMIIASGTDGSTVNGLLGMYIETGDDEGIYKILTEQLLASLAYEYNPEANAKWIMEFRRWLSAHVPRVHECDNPYTIPMHNGLFNYKTKKLRPFTPDEVFLAKSPVDMPESKPELPRIGKLDGTYWDPLSWLRETVPDDATRHQLMQVMCAALRPYQDWQHFVIFYSEDGSTGKSTVAESMRQMVGLSVCSSLPLTGFFTRFGMQQLIGKRLNVSDEQDASALVSRADALKSVTTGDPVSVDRKGLPAIMYQPHILCVFCTNDLPHIRDKGESMLRRMLILPFTQHFDEEHKDRLIKTTYLKDPKVLSWFAWQLLMELEDFDHLETTDTSKMMLEAFQQDNDPVAAIWNEVKPGLHEAFLPFDEFYGFYLVTMKANYPSSHPENRNKVIGRLSKLAESDDTWMVVRDKDGESKVKQVQRVRMDDAHGAARSQSGSV